MQLVVHALAGPVVHVYPDTPLGVCARLMLRHRFRHLPVVDADQRPEGVVEDADVFQHGALLGPDMDLWLAFEPDSDRLRAADVMGPFGGRVAPGSSMLRALVLLDRARGQALAVVDDEERLVGLVTEHDAVVVARDLVGSEVLVGDACTRDPSTVDWLLPAAEALEQMVAGGFRHLVVLKEGALHGVVSLRDLVAENVSQRPDFVVHDAMRGGPVHTIGVGESLREAADRMCREHVGCLPVLDDEGAVVGVLTRTDLRRACVEALRRAAASDTDASILAGTLLR